MVQKRVWVNKSHKMRVCKLRPILCSTHISRATFSVMETPSWLPVDYPLIRNVPHFRYTLIGQEATHCALGTASGSGKMQTQIYLWSWSSRDLWKLAKVCCVLDVFGVQEEADSDARWRQRKSLIDVSADALNMMPHPFMKQCFGCYRGKM